MENILKLIHEKMCELEDREFCLLNDQANYEDLQRMEKIVEDQMAGDKEAGYKIKYGRVWYSWYAGANEEVIKFFPKIMEDW